MDVAEKPDLSGLSVDGVSHDRHVPCAERPVCAERQRRGGRLCKVTKQPFHLLQNVFGLVPQFATSLAGVSRRSWLQAFILCRQIHLQKSWKARGLRFGRHLRQRVGARQDNR